MSEKRKLSPLTPPVPTNAGGRTDWAHLYGASRGLAVASAAEGHPGPMLVAVPDPAAALKLETELKFFLAGNESVPVMHFPDWETLPYDVFSPHQDIVSDRLEILARLPGLKRGILVAPVTSMMVRMPPAPYVSGHSLELAVGQRLDLDAFRGRLESAGYRCVSQVMEHGEFAVRGAIVDLFPMGGSDPLRVDLFDEDIESIRTFDPESQRSAQAVERVRLLPAREFPMTEDAVRRFRQAWRERFEGDPNDCPIYRDVSGGLRPAGIEYYLPLFFEQTSTLFDYLPPDTLVIEYEDVYEAAQAFDADVRGRYSERAHDRERPLLPPSEMFVDSSQTYAALKPFMRVRLRRFQESSDETQHAFATRAPLKLPVDARAEAPLAPVKRFIEEFPGRVLFVAESPGRRETLLETFRAHQLDTAVVPGWIAFRDGDVPVAVT
ncbi:MAG: transcription-repair coupling factor, partial [Gammaproteobacteria bacterium]|nr:transcription-repair coupling factor [Gammaproteobacteria bacterium]